MPNPLVPRESLLGHESRFVIQVLVFGDVHPEINETAQIGHTPLDLFQNGERPEAQSRIIGIEVRVHGRDTAVADVDRGHRHERITMPDRELLRFATTIDEEGPVGVAIDAVIADAQIPFVAVAIEQADTVEIDRRRRPHGGQLSVPPVEDAAE